jgi:hypothetical protein
MTFETAPHRVTRHASLYDDENNNIVLTSIRVCCWRTANVAVVVVYLCTHVISIAPSLPPSLTHSVSQPANVDYTHTNGVSPLL